MPLLTRANARVRGRSLFGSADKNNKCQDAKQLTAADFEVYRIDGDEVAEMLADILYLDERICIAVAVS